MESKWWLVALDRHISVVDTQLGLPKMTWIAGLKNIPRKPFLIMCMWVLKGSGYSRRRVVFWGIASVDDKLVFWAEVEVGGYE